MALPRSSSSGMKSIRRELQLRKRNALEPTPPVTKKTSAPPPPPPPPPRGGGRDKFQEPRPRPPREEDRFSTISQSRGTHAPPQRRLPRPPASVTASPSFAASAPPAPPPPSESISTRSKCAANSSTTGHLKPGTRVHVRTRTQTVIDGKTLVLWLGGMVVSATDGGYEIVYEGKLPRDDPFSTVCVPIHHVRPFKPSPPPSQPPSAAATATTLQTAGPKNQGTQPVPRPTTAGKSIRLLNKIASEMQAMQPLPQAPEKSMKLVRNLASDTKPAPRPTTARKRIGLLSDLMSENEFQPVDTNVMTQKPSPQIPQPQRAANRTHAAASKTSKLQTAPRPTPAGKIVRLLHSRPTAMKPKPRPTTAGKSLRLLSSLSPETKPTSRPTTAGKSIRLLRNLISEKEFQPIDMGVMTQKPSPQRASNPTLAAASKTSKLQTAPRPTPPGQIVRLLHSRPTAMKPKSRPMSAGKSLRLIRDLAQDMKKAAPRPTTAGKSTRLLHSRLTAMKPQPRPTTAGKSLRLLSSLPPETKPAPRPTTAGKSISIIRRTLSEKDRQDLDAVLAARQLSLK